MPWFVISLHGDHADSLVYSHGTLTHRALAGSFAVNSSQSAGETTGVTTPGWWRRMDDEHSKQECKWDKTLISCCQTLIKNLFSFADRNFKTDESWMLKSFSVWNRPCRCLTGAGIRHGNDILRRLGSTSVISHPWVNICQMSFPKRQQTQEDRHESAFLQRLWAFVMTVDGCIYLTWRYLTSVSKESPSTCPVGKQNMNNLMPTKPFHHFEHFCLYFGSHTPAFGSHFTSCHSSQLFPLRPSSPCVFNLVSLTDSLTVSRPGLVLDHTFFWEICLFLPTDLDTSAWLPATLCMTCLVMRHPPPSPPCMCI